MASVRGWRAGRTSRGRTVRRVIWESVRDEARRAVVERGLTPAAVAHLTHDALGTVDLSVLAPVKGLLKRFFSDQPWTPDDDRLLADLVGA